MKLLLIIPPYNILKRKDNSYLFPVGIAYVNRALRDAGFDVCGLNMNHIEAEDRFAILAGKIVEGKIDCVLCGGLCTHWSIIKKVFDTAKQARPGIITIGGGGMITSEPISCAELLGVDYAVIGEGEITDVELVQALIDNNDVSKVKGIVYKTETGEYKQTLPREQIKDLDSIAFPSYEDLDMDKYLDEQRASDIHTFSYDRPRVMSMVMGRSCPYQCKFCFHPSGNTYRTRSLDNFFMELDEVMEKYAPRQLVIMDELFSVSLKRVYDFCERIKPYKLKWIIQMRVDIITPEMLNALHDAGCVSISYGLESFSAKVLKNMRKNITPEQIERALKLTYEASIDIQGNFIFGDELEDESTIYETMRFWFDHPEYMINITMIQTYPGSGYYKDLVENNEQFDKKAFLERDDWRVNLTRFSDDEYWKYVAVFKLLLFYYHPPKIVGNIKQTYQDENGEWIVETTCAHCGKTNVYHNVRESMFRQSYFTLLCNECNHRSVYYCRKERLQNWDKLEYLCRMVATAKDEHDFKEAVDTLYLVYMETMDPDNPFPKIFEGSPRVEK